MEMSVKEAQGARQWEVDAEKNIKEIEESLQVLEEEQRERAMEFETIKNKLKKEKTNVEQHQGHLREIKRETGRILEKTWTLQEKEKKNKKKEDEDEEEWWRNALKDIQAEKKRHEEMKTKAENNIRELEKRQKESERFLKDAENRLEQTRNRLDAQRRQLAELAIRRVLTRR
jgi:chromosome segregation ATPase